MPLALQHTRAAVRLEASQTGWVQPSSQMAILQTQEKIIKKMKARVIQPNWGRETGAESASSPSAASNEGTSRVQPARDTRPEGKTHS